MLILHANWTGRALHLWGESLSRWHGPEADHPLEDDAAEPRGGGATGGTGGVVAHPFIASHDELAGVLSRMGAPAEVIDRTSCTLRLPSAHERPEPSRTLATMVGATGNGVQPHLREWSVPALRVHPEAALEWLTALEPHARPTGIEFGPGLRFMSHLGDLALRLLAEQRFVPTLLQTREAAHRALWQPWLHDEETIAALTGLLDGMPAAFRAVVDEFEHQPWPILEEALRGLVDPLIRRWLLERSFHEAIEEQDPARDPHVAWLVNLLSLRSELVDRDAANMTELLTDARSWLARLQDASSDQPYRLLLRLEEPTSREPLPELKPADQSITWTLAFLLRSTHSRAAAIPAEAIWDGGESSLESSLNSSRAQELLLTELGRAARIYPAIQQALEEATPSSLTISTDEAYEFLREHAPILREAGVEVDVPSWWGQVKHRLGLRLEIRSGSMTDEEATRHGVGVGRSPRTLGLDTLVDFRWQLAIGDRTLDHELLKALAMRKAALVPMDGAWVEIDPETLRAARQFMAQDSEGRMSVLEALRTAYGFGERAPTLPVFGIDASGWVSDLFDGGTGELRAIDVAQPPALQGELRPYQKRGLSWLVFLDRLGLGACLADDMGLGKTIQLIALLLYEREHVEAMGPVGPTLVVAPMSVVGNWVNEIKRFAPQLRVHVHHGVERLMGESFLDAARGHDVVVTTYGLVTRDIESLGRVPWRRIVLDEAQFIKNPPTKQSRAIRSLLADRRIALTGTPVENRLGELWSILEFCNPGYLGSAGEFRRRFVLPIERRRDEQAAVSLRALIRPFVLRRVKTDPDVVPDLPDLVQTKDYAILSPEQARLYQSVVDGMLRAVDQSDGIQRRGLVLAGLIRLKQVCNHPANMATEREDDLPFDAARLMAGDERQSMRSGKVMRLMEMLEEVLAAGDKALIFTQFRRMGHLLQAMIGHDLGAQTLFLHGGTPRAKRDELIHRFQSDDRVAPIFLLSLRAGGVGLNLTAANHVFHFDRWWNPAVENQATDRAFRIGQKRTVHVHKLICRGTLEERIDEMLEQKTELAERIVGTDESWLTELSTTQLHDLLSLRRNVMEVEA